MILKSRNWNGLIRTSILNLFLFSGISVFEAWAECTCGVWSMYEASIVIVRILLIFIVQDDL